MLLDRDLTQLDKQGTLPQRQAPSTIDDDDMQAHARLSWSMSRVVLELGRHGHTG